MDLDMTLEQSGWPGGKWRPYPAAYGATVVANVPVVMSDGVTLIADIEYPADPHTGERAPGRFPVLLTQNPYGGENVVGAVTGEAAGPTTNPGHDYFVTRGYIFVTVCVRGTGRSGGDFEFFGAGRVAEDGKEVVYWAAQTLDGSNGDVGLTGLSFLGMTQLFTAALLPKGSPVKAIAPFGSGAETYREDIMGQGMPTQTLSLRAEGFYQIIGQKGGDWGAALYKDIISGGPRAYSGDFWLKQTPGAFAADIAASGIPILLWSGWADIFNLGAQELYAYVQNAHFGRPVYRPMQAGDKVSARYHIVMGPWEHGGGVDQDLMLLWFDTWLKGQDTGIAETVSPMHLFDAVTQEWINTDLFPMTTNYTPHYLAADGRLSLELPALDSGVSIEWTQPDADGGRLVYTSDPLPDGATLAGPIGARLYARSSGTNLQLIASLFDVAPNGSATKLTTGYVIGSLAEQDEQRAWYDGQGLPIRTYGRFDKDRYLKSGEVRAFDFWLSPRVATIHPGHALRVVLTTQTLLADTVGLAGVDPCFPTAPQLETLPGTYQILHARQTPSAINLPLLPLNIFKAAGGGSIPRDWG